MHRLAPSAAAVAPRDMEIDSRGVVFNSWHLTWFDEVMAATLIDGVAGPPTSQRSVVHSISNSCWAFW